VVVKTKKNLWQDATNAKIDPRNTYLCKLPSGKEINLFFYDGPISQAIAFERLLDNGDKFAHRLIKQVHENNDLPKMINIATDGETYGHHHRFGEMGLTYCLHVIDKIKDVKLTVYGEYLENHPPEYEVEIIENSSWSCYHGVERWNSNCGCNTGGRAGWNQEWRKPVRDAFDWLRDNLVPLYEKQMNKFVDNPWKIRDEYIDLILDRSESNVDRFFYKHVVKAS
jgi:alpha-amylase/alpha-mannosidase (GH57 family)